MRIAIVNDSVMAVEVLKRLVLKVPEYQVAWVAFDGAEAVSKCAVNTPDLILMDVLMPKMDGVEATKQIMQHYPCAILMVTASVDRYAAQVFAAMGYGALDAINTPVLGTSQSTDGHTRLLKKIATIARLIGKFPSRSLTKQNKPHSPESKSLAPLIVIGASTGGPQALVKILSQFPQDLSAAIVITQHIDAEFTQGFVTWLDEQIDLPVEIASNGAVPQAGKVLVAGTNHHLVMHPNQSLGYSHEPLDCIYHPSIDVFFSSVAHNCTGKGVAVLLTGMGRDGAEGLKHLRTAGWHTIAQDKSTSVIYGMPKAAWEMGAVVEMLPIDAIAPTCVKQLYI
ncbi:MAG TPA: chemotaxis response regulator protein-glutamate methylesterase [Nostocaceae cyanobacterium]|nr:chemotaxis response regulator protein-glutamate methylesterase [Nostocaceae cyanobacterium]